MKKLTIGAIVFSIATITTISCIVISKNTSSSQPDAGADIPSNSMEAKTASSKSNKDNNPKEASDETGENTEKDSSENSNSSPSENTTASSSEVATNPTQSSNTEASSNEPNLEEIERARNYNPYGRTYNPDNTLKGLYMYKDYCPTQAGAFNDSWGMSVCSSQSYAAWKVYQYYGEMPNWYGRSMPNQWIHNALAEGYTVSDTPKINTVGIVVIPNGYGHAFWVEAISDDGAQIYVSQYNVASAANGYTYGDYSEQWMPAAGVKYIEFARRD